MSKVGGLWITTQREMNGFRPLGPPGEAVIFPGRPLPVQCVNTVSVVRRNLLNIAHVNSARDFSTTIIGDARPTPRSHSAVIGYSPLSNIEQISIQLRCNILVGWVSNSMGNSHARVTTYR